MTKGGSAARFRPFLPLFLLSACGQAKPNPLVPGAAPAPPSGVSQVHGADAGVPSDASAAPSTTADAGTAAEAPPDAAPAGDCPAGMILVDTNYCSRIQRKCLSEEYSPQNHIFICHKFAKTHRCLVEEERRRFCIDQYEYPNQEGAHPAWMVSWYDAQATCALRGKRLCYESEWVSACEGPDKTPFPYGYSRDNSKCNIDNQWIKPSLAELYARGPEARARELSRLDQSARSGAVSECVSGFGVHDMTGNFDEWVTADRPRDTKSEWTALKGGAWGHVRNACRPTTTSHPPDFTYYFVSFRCCKDAKDSEAPKPRDVPDVEAADRAPIPAPVDPVGPSRTKVAREYWPRPKWAPLNR